MSRSPYVRRRESIKRQQEKCPYRDNGVFPLFLDAQIEAEQRERHNGEQYAIFKCRPCYAYHIRRMESNELPD